MESVGLRRKYFDLIDPWVTLLYLQMISMVLIESSNSHHSLFNYFRAKDDKESDTDDSSEEEDAALEKAMIEAQFSKSEQVRGCLKKKRKITTPENNNGIGVVRDATNNDLLLDSTETPFDYDPIANGQVQSSIDSEVSNCTRYKYNDQIVELNPDTIVINGPVTGTRTHCPDYRYHEICNDLLRTVSKLSQVTLSLTQFSSKDVASPDSINSQYQQAFLLASSATVLLTQWMASYNAQQQTDTVETAVEVSNAITTTTSATKENEWMADVLTPPQSVENNDICGDENGKESAPSCSTTMITDSIVSHQRRVRRRINDEDTAAVSASVVNPTIYINNRAYPVKNLLHYNPDNLKNKLLVKEGKMVEEMTINTEVVEVPIHPWTVSKKKHGSRPRCYPTTSILEKLQPIMIDNSDGADIHEVIFNNNTKNFVFFAHKQSQNPLLREIHKCYSENRHRIACLAKQLPAKLWEKDCLAGGEYLPAGIAKRGKVKGGSSKLPFLRKSSYNNMVTELYDHYAEILGLEAQLIKEYFPDEYTANHDLYSGGEDCIFPSPLQQQQNGHVDSGVYWGVHQVALRKMGCESSIVERAEKRMAWHVDQSDVKSNQLLTFLPMGGKYGRGGHVLDSDLMVFEHETGGKCFRLNTTIEDTVVFILMNSGQQMHGSAMDSQTKRNGTLSFWSARFIAYGRNNVRRFVEKRKRGEKSGEAFWDGKLTMHTPLDRDKIKVGNKVSAMYGKGKGRKLLTATIENDDNKLWFRWDVDNQKTECRKWNIYSVECAHATKPHKCLHCNGIALSFPLRNLG
jgi:hypothetical protein